PCLEVVHSVAPRVLRLRARRPVGRHAGDETPELAGMTFETPRVPGHSPAHLACHADGSLFSGDVLFAGSVGRTDLPGGDWDTLLASVRSLLNRYGRDAVVYPGHGSETTLGLELDTNPFLSELRVA